jgi:hypothetical protein
MPSTGTGTGRPAVEQISPPIRSTTPIESSLSWRVWLLLAADDEPPLQSADALNLTPHARLALATPRALVSRMRRRRRVGGAGRVRVTDRRLHLHGPCCNDDAIDRDTGCRDA